MLTRHHSADIIKAGVLLKPGSTKFQRMKILGKLIAAVIFLIIANAFAFGQNDSPRLLNAPAASETKNVVAATVERLSPTSVKVTFDLSIVSVQSTGTVNFSAQPATLVKDESGTTLKLLDQAATIKMILSGDGDGSEPLTAKPEIIVPTGSEASAIKLAIMGIARDASKPITLILPIKPEVGSSSSGKIKF